MGEIRTVGPGKTRGYPYPVCKKIQSLKLEDCLLLQAEKTWYNNYVSQCSSSGVLFKLSIHTKCSIKNLTEIRTSETKQINKIYSSFTGNFIVNQIHPYFHTAITFITLSCSFQPLNLPCN